MKHPSLLETPVCDHCGRALEASDFLMDIPPVPGPRPGPLTLRERQLVELVKQAKSNKEIAFELSLTVGSVKEYMYRLFRKLGVKNRTELALWDGRTNPERVVETVL